MDGNYLIDDDSPSEVGAGDVRDEAASLAIAVLRAAKRFHGADRLLLLENVCEELAGARDRLKSELRGNEH